ncbi:MAG: flagellar biosynthetic protein FliQ [Spirochaetes bacterium GWF1_49_6]|nr:MAG: flagellar biosynthetic protein FliQ [Spirochaetes bacterium GWF1_49_6]
MSQGLVLQIVNETIYIIIILLIPLLGVWMIIGLIISIIQATTSIQEQTLTFVPKMIAILLLLVFFGPFFLNSLIDFTNRLMNMIANAKM